MIRGKSRGVGGGPGKAAFQAGLLIAGSGLLLGALANAAVTRRRATTGSTALQKPRPVADAASMHGVPSLAATIAAMPKGLPRAKAPPLDLSIAAARAAVDACTAAGVKISVLIADSMGDPVVLLSGDGAGVRSALITRSKAAIVVKYGIPSIEVLKRAEREPRLNAEAEADPNIGMLRGGAFPVVVNGERIGIVAVSGAGVAGTREMDDACAMVAVERLTAG